MVVVVEFEIEVGFGVAVTVKALGRDERSGGEEEED